jgi:hypothetical protein
MASWSEVEDIDFAARCSIMNIPDQKHRNGLAQD